MKSKNGIIVDSEVKSNQRRYTYRRADLLSGIDKKRLNREKSQLKQHRDNRFRQCNNS